MTTTLAVPMTPPPPLRPKRWVVATPAPADFLPHLPRLVAQLLYNRAILTRAEADTFLSDDLATQSGDPFTLKGMPEALARLNQAIARQELIVIYGDFDADGITATALLTETLRVTGAQVRPFIPKRLEHGYGLNREALDLLASEGTRLVITVDNGISSLDEVCHARELGIDVIVTDHHHCPGTLPPALAVINPKQPGCLYPFKELAGVGVAYKLAQAIQSRLITGRATMSSPPFDLRSALDLVALGTVADLAPLIGENRALVRAGLNALNRTTRPGLKAMINRAGLKPGTIDTGHIGFGLGPRLNAAGRLADAIVSYNLLLSQDEREAMTLAEQLERHNTDRQNQMKEMVEIARQAVQTASPDRPFLFVVGDQYADGIIGLVASRLVEEFYRPALVINLGKEKSRGSARSIREFHITDALQACSDLLERFGGHAMAAGLTIRNENIPALEARLDRLSRNTLAGLDLKPIVDIDAEVSLNDLTQKTYEWLARLAPFGYSNPTPLFVSRGLKVSDSRRVGSDSKHLKLTLTDGRRWLDAIAFRWGEWETAVRRARSVDVVFALEFNDWSGQLQMNIKDLKVRE